MKRVTILFFALVFAFCETYAQQRERYRLERRSAIMWSSATTQHSHLQVVTHTTIGA